MLSLAVIQQQYQRRNLRTRFRPERVKCFELPDDEFVSNFRLTKTIAECLIEELRPMLEPRSPRKNAFAVETKVFTALSFFASGGYQKRVGNEFMVSMPQRSVSKCINDVAKAMNVLMLQRYVTFPRDSRMQGLLKAEFHDYCGLTGVLGAVDCTHVAIIAPSDDDYHNESSYLNRKLYHSINVQLVCDMKQKVMNVVARYPGACHDSFIWRSSKLRERFQNNLIHGNGWLLGDSGYPYEDWLYTPVSGAVDGSPDAQYNVRHSRGRSVIERCNGTLKARFRCLLKHRVLHYHPEKAALIINSCVILHNMCIEANLQWTDTSVLEEDDHPWNTTADHDN